MKEHIRGRGLLQPPVPLNQEISHGAAARPSLKMIHWIIFRALRPSWTSLRNRLAATVLLARRLKAASPDASHPGKAGEESEGKARFPSRIFPGFLGPEAHKLSSPQANGGCCRVFPMFCVRQVWVQGVNPLAQVWGPKRPENLPLGWFSAEAGPEGPGHKSGFPQTPFRESHRKGAVAEN